MQTSSSLLAAIAIGIVALGFTGCGSAPPPPGPERRCVERTRAAGFVEAMKPRRAGKPVVAVLALNDATEMTDFLLPHAVLKRADVAEVHAVAPRRGRVTLYPALEVESAEDLDGFDRDASLGRRLRHRPGDERRRRSCRDGLAATAGESGCPGHRHLQRRARRGPGRPARWPSLRRPLVRPRHAAFAPSRRDLRAAPTLPGRWRDRHHHRDHGVDSNPARAGRGDRWPPEGGLAGRRTRRDLVDPGA